MTDSVALQSRPETRGAPVSRKAETVPRYLSLQQEERLRDWGYSDRIILGSRPTRHRLRITHLKPKTISQS